MALFFGGSDRIPPREAVRIVRLVRFRCNQVEGYPLRCHPVVTGIDFRCPTIRSQRLHEQIFPPLRACRLEFRESLEDAALQAAKLRDLGTKGCRPNLEWNALGSGAITACGVGNYEFGRKTPLDRIDAFVCLGQPLPGLTLHPPFSGGLHHPISATCLEISLGGGEFGSQLAISDDAGLVGMFVRSGPLPQTVPARSYCNSRIAVLQQLTIKLVRNDDGSAKRHWKLAGNDHGDAMRVNLLRDRGSWVDDVVRSS